MICDCTAPVHLVMLDDGHAVDRLIATDLDVLIGRVVTTWHQRYLLLCSGCGKTLADSGT